MARRDTADPGVHPDALMRRLAGNFSLIAIGSFLLLWLPVGFVFGTMILLGPVRWWASFCRRSGYPPAVETAGVLGMILLLVLGTALLTYVLLRWVNQHRLPLKIIVIAGVVLTAGAVYRLWLDPTLFSGRMGLLEAGAQFTFGPYPTEADLLELKEKGYTVVSLLHPAVVPFEPQLIAQERAMTEKLGIPFIHIPMLPWVSSNADGIKRVKALLEDKSKHYYVHCYLGKDRVQIVRSVIERSAPGAQTESRTKRRSLSEKIAFERGGVFELGGDGWVTPYPTDQELASYFVSGEVRQVVALLDPREPEDRMRIDHERVLLDRYDVPFEVIPVSRTYDPEVILRAAQQVRRLPRPVVVHAFFSPPAEGNTAVAEAFIQAYRLGKPPLPPFHFREPMAGGQAEVAAPNVAIGPRPAPAEFSQLRGKGVRNVISIGSGASPLGADDLHHAEAAGLHWVRVRSVDDALKVISRGGPYYLYGADRAETVRRVASEYGPALPLQ